MTTGGASCRGSRRGRPLVRKLTGDAQLARARQAFDAVEPHAEALRDLVAHLDEYATGTGRRQTGELLPKIQGPYLSTLVYWTNGGETTIRLGDEDINVGSAARAEVQLAEVVERVRMRWLARAEREADEALRRRSGLGERCSRRDG